jgi:cytochrome c553
MARLLRWFGIAALGLVGLLLLAVLAIFGLSELALRKSYEARAETLAAPSPAQFADGARQARVLGCVTCHGEDLRGRTFKDIPNVVRIAAPNLPAVAAKASDQQLAAAIRQGIGHDGRGLWVMPSALYSRLDDAEVAALIAHIRGLPRREGRTEGFSAGPIGRLAIVLGKLRPQPAKMEQFKTQAPIPRGPSHARGRRLAANLCADCHGPALFGARLEDGQTSPDLNIAAAYDADQFRTLMRTGKAPGQREVGLMSEVARSDFRHLTDAEIQALHLYLQARAERLGN